MDAPYIFLNLRVGDKSVIGESTERSFEKQIAIESLSWDMECSHKPVVDQRKDSNKVVTLSLPKRVTVTKSFDRSTVNLCDYMAKRQAFEVAKFTMVKSLVWEDKPRPHIEITLNKGYVESVSLTASESDKSVGVKESVTLSFSTITILYYFYPSSRHGSNAAAITFQMDMPSEIA